MYIFSPYPPDIHLQIYIRAASHLQEDTSKFISKQLATYTVPKEVASYIKPTRIPHIFPPSM